MFRTSRICFQPKFANGDNSLWLLVSLGFTLGTNLTSGIISFLASVRLYMNKNTDFKINWATQQHFIPSECVYDLKL